MWHPRDENLLKILGISEGYAEEEDLNNESSPPTKDTTSTAQDDGLLKTLETKVAELTKQMDGIAVEVRILRSQWTSKLIRARRQTKNAAPDVEERTPAKK
ncbi:hypothetical protein C5167_038789 [Papaver somniferum]|uniref:Uncharacterized protein n=1 Tax=Papaver somniferum TaxID=3469 RepID=A0A4Y7IDW0_PAPSO|nr:hypothetical protein C5167_038789 [Papaver somniferum]